MKTLAIACAALAAFFVFVAFVVADGAAFLFVIIFGLLALIFAGIASHQASKRDRRKLAALEALAATQAAYPRQSHGRFAHD